MASKDEQVLCAAKEMVAKLIKLGKVSPTTFPDTFREIYRTIYKTAQGKSEDSRGRQRGRSFINKLRSKGRLATPCASGGLRDILYSPLSTK